jgi:hypothetical protein
MSATNSAGRTHRSTLKRRGVIATVVLSLTIGLAATIPTLPADAASATKITIKAGPGHSTRSGVVTTLRGTAKGQAAGTKVKVQKSLNGKRWTTLKTTTTKVGGSWKAKVKLTKSTKLRASITPRGTNKPVTSRVLKIVVQQSIKARLTSPASIDAGGVATVTGRATKGLVGQTIFLQAAGSGGLITTWSTIGSARIGHGGSFVVTGRVAEPGAGTAIRVVVNGAPAKGVAAATATAASINVWGWYAPDEGWDSPVPRDSHSYGLDNMTFAWNGVRYFDSILIDESTDILTYTPGGRCDRFTTTLITDDASFTPAVDIDSRTNAWTYGPIPVDVPVPVTVPIGAANKVAFHVLGISRYSSGAFAFASVSFHCLPDGDD